MNVVLVKSNYHDEYMYIWVHSTGSTGSTCLYIFNYVDIFCTHNAMLVYECVINVFNVCKNAYTQRLMINDNYMHDKPVAY